MYHLLVILGLVFGVPVIIITLIGVLSNEPTEMPQDPCYGMIPKDFEFGVGKCVTDGKGHIVHDVDRYYSNPNGNYRG